MFSSCFQIVSEGEDVIDMERTKRLLDTTQNQRLKDLLTKYEIIDIEVRAIIKLKILGAKHTRSLIIPNILRIDDK